MLLHDILLYVQHFHCVGQDENEQGILQENDINMHLLEQEFHETGSQYSHQHSQMESIIPLVYVTHPIDIIPVFGHKMDSQLT